MYFKELLKKRVDYYNQLSFIDLLKFRLKCLVIRFVYRNKIQRFSLKKLVG